MIGLSCYIIADTFFISKAIGATGIAALNFSISIYSIISGLGFMIGMGGATRYSILKTREKYDKANQTYTLSISIGLIIGLILIIIGILWSRPLADVLGADATTIDMTNAYLKTILVFAPFFIVNNTLLAFIRNDYNPRLAMIAMLAGSFSNIALTLQR